MIHPTREFWQAIRHALLMVIGAIEKLLDITPTTKEMRQKHKQH